MTELKPNFLFSENCDVFHNFMLQVYCKNGIFVYKILNFYFPLDFPLPCALQIVIGWNNNPEDRSKYGRIGIKIEESIYVWNHLSISLFYCRKGNAFPTMFVHRNCVFDIHVPLHIIFNPKSNYQITCGPGDICDEKYCKNCSSYGVYNGVFIALCTSCSESYNGNHCYTGYIGIGIDFYSIRPEYRQQALPSHFPLDFDLNNIGYANEELQSCSTIIMERENTTKYFDINSVEQNTENTQEIVEEDFESEGSI